MTNEEAKEYFMQHERVDDKEQSEAVWCAIKALEKQIPKPVIDNEEERWFMCPTCNDYVIPYNKGTAHHCECGQALLWMDEE